MITKAYIISETDNNTYNVRIPIFENNGNQTLSDDLTGDDIVTYEATLSYNPGTLDSYHAGDVVYVSFEDNDYANVVILGKLYQGNEEKSTNYQSAQTLNVSGSTELSSETYIDGVKIDNIYLKQSDFNQYTKRLDSMITYRILDEYD